MPGELERFPVNFCLGQGTNENFLEAPNSTYVLNKWIPGVRSLNFFEREKKSLPELYESYSHSDHTQQNI